MRRFFVSFYIKRRKLSIDSAALQKKASCLSFVAMMYSCSPRFSLRQKLSSFYLHVDAKNAINCSQLLYTFLVIMNKTIGVHTTMSKKQLWFDVEELETIEQCLERMEQQGYMPVGRREEPIFHIVNGEPTVLRQKIQFKGLKVEE